MGDITALLPNISRAVYFGFILVNGEEVIMSHPSFLCCCDGLISSFYFTSLRIWSNITKLGEKI